MPELLNDEKLNLIAVFLLLLVSLLVSFKRDNRESSSIFLVAYFWLFFYGMLMTYLVNYRYVVLVPHLFRTGFPVSLLVMPASFLYVRQSLIDRRLKWSDLLHLLPMLVFLADFLPFYLQSAKEKVDYIQSLSDQELMIGMSQGSFMPTYGHSLIRYGQVIVYCSLQFALIYRSSKGKGDEGKKEFLSWLKFMTVAELFAFLVPLVIVAIVGTAIYGLSASISFAVVVMLQGLYLFFRPTILYGLSQEQKESEQPEVLKEEYYNDEVLEEVGRVIEGYMQAQKPYLLGKFRVQDLAASTGISVHKISAYVNRKKQMNFFTYMNQYRIRECLAKLDSGEHETKTLEAIADECGFQNRTTFIRVFKQVTGKTPSEYLSSRS